MVLLCVITILTAFVVPVVAATATVYESNTIMNGNDIFNGSYWRAQTFTPSQTHTVTSVQMPFINRGTSAGDITVSIRATNASGMPTGSDLATGTIPVARLTKAWTPAVWYTFDMGTGCTVEAGKSYAIIWRAEAASSVYYWMNISNSYAGGRVMYSTGGNSWANLGVWDAAFRVYGESGTTPPPTTPPGTVAPYENMTSINGNWDVFGTTWRAQTFKPAVSHTVTSVQIPLLRRGAAAGDIVVSIRATNASGMPAGTDLASGVIPSSSLTTLWTPAVWYTFNLGSGCVVEAGKTYAILLRAASATASTGLYYWVNLSGTYAGGQALTSSGGTTWSVLNVWDTGFRESGIADTTPPTPGENHAPIFNPIGNKTAVAGQSLTITLGASDTDGDTLTYTTGALPAGSSFLNNSFYWTSPVAGTYPLTFSVSDGKLSDSETITLTVTTGQSSAGFKNVGFVSIFFLDSVINTVKWNQFTHMIWQNVMVNSASDPTLHVQDGYPWSQITSFVNACHAHNVKALICLFGNSELNTITSNPALRARLVANLNTLINQYGADGINIDWEGSGNPANYSTFIQEMRASFGPNKIITAIGTWLGPPVNIAASAAPYMDFVTVMTYDYWVVPSNGTLEKVSASMNMWHNAGFPKEKLVMAIPFFATTGAGTTGWTPYKNLVSSHPDMSPSLNSGWGYYWNGQDLVKQKVAWVKNNGFGGIFNYELGTDALTSPLSLADAVWQAISQ
jgi:hypothetical protein